jgi:tetratricopeptide (TPR) repeat protein
VTSQRSEAEFGTLPGLFRRYLEKRAAAHATSLAEPGPGEVVPFEAVPIQPPDPKAAWDAALEAAKFYGPPALPRIPANWPELMAHCAAELALPFCLGNYPQLVRDLAPFVEPADLTRLLPTVSRSPRRPDTVEHCALPKPSDNPIQILFSVASFRLAKEYDQAAELLRHYRDKIPPQYAAAWANEEAALAWHSGRVDEAQASWESQSDIAPVLFNRGVAAVFSNRSADARSFLKQAVSQIQDGSPWYHLGSFYIALAETIA